MTMLENALAYAARGWHVFPLKPNGKTPRTEHGFKDAVTDPDQIKAWWSEEPEANIGIATGTSGFVVIDGDVKHGDDPLASLLGLGSGMPPETLRATTPSGGWHLYFRAPKGVEIRNSAGKLGPGLDVRADGGYVVAPPSVVDGKHYEWTNGFDEPIAPLPAHLAEAMVKAVGKGSTPRGDAISGQVHDMIPEGERNVTLTSLAGTMRRRGMSPAAIEAGLLVENAARCCPPLDEAEVKVIAKSVSRYTPSEPADLLKQALAGLRQQAGHGEPAGLRLVSAGEIVKKAGPISWLVKGYLESDALIQLFGPPGSYKSFIALDIAVAVSSGCSWHEQPVRAGLVIYIAGEGHNGLGRRLSALCEFHGIDPDTLLLAFSSHAVGLSDEANAAELLTLVQNRIESTGHHPVLFVIDTVARNFGAGDENSTSDMTRFIGHVDKIRKPFGASMLLLHHTGHGNLERERGSSALRGAIDANFKVEFNADSHLITLCCLKMKDAELAPPLLMEPKTTELAIKDDDGNNATSVVLVAAKGSRVEAAERFYAKHPDLRKGKRRTYLPGLFEALYDNPGTSERRIAQIVGVGLSTIQETLGLLHKHKLVEKDPLRLTDGGLRVAGFLCNRLDIIMAPQQDHVSHGGDFFD